jgi:hypothetical protein
VGIGTLAAQAGRRGSAVGYHTNTAGTNQTLTEDWNGKKWKLQRSPNEGTTADANEPAGVAAISPAETWLVGDIFTGTEFHSLIECWNGKAWKG